MSLISLVRNPGIVMTWNIGNRDRIGIGNKDSNFMPVQISANSSMGGEDSNSAAEKKPREWPLWISGVTLTHR